MLDFRTWLSRADLTESKRKHRPDNRVDDFLNQIIGLASDMDKETKLKPKPLPQKPMVKASPGEEQLISLAKVALANLKSSPDYYNTRAADLKAGGSPSSNSGKVTRDDALRAARELGVNFGETEFNQEALRKGIEAEFNRTSAFSKNYDPEKKLV